jgi:hypothetical protein
MNAILLAQGSSPADRSYSTPEQPDLGLNEGARPNGHVCLPILSLISVLIRHLKISLRIPLDVDKDGCVRSC